MPPKFVRLNYIRETSDCEITQQAMMLLSFAKYTADQVSLLLLKWTNFVLSVLARQASFPPGQFALCQRMCCSELLPGRRQ